MLGSSNSYVNEERKRAIKAAKDLLYGEEVIRKLKIARNIAEISNIMKTERKKA